MQAWGTSSRFSIRDTGKEPSKSGVIGLFCAALGISRDNANLNNAVFAKLTHLRICVRVLREGIVQNDFHTAQNVATADGKKPKPTELSTRWYLSDADFLVGVEGDDLELMQSIHSALQKPKWQIFLGRKAFVPSIPVYLPMDGVRDGDADTVLRQFEFEGNFATQRLVIEDELGAEVRRDVPLDFATRRFSVRRVRTEFLLPHGVNQNDGNLPDKNDIEPALP